MYNAYNYNKYRNYDSGGSKNKSVLNSKIGNADGKEVTLKDSALMGKYAELKHSETASAGSRSIMGDAKNSSANLEKVSSNLEYVTEHMNALRRKINSTNFVSSFKEAEFKRKDNYQETMNKCLNKYFDISGKLLDIVAKEAAASISYAQVMEDMDRDIAKKAGDL